MTEAPAAGTTLASITTVAGGGPLQQPVVDVPNRRATLFINAYHGEKATFNNVAAPTQCVDKDKDNDKDKKAKSKDRDDDDRDCKGEKEKKCDADKAKKDPKVHDENHDCRSEQGEKSDKKYSDG